MFNDKFLKGEIERLSSEIRGKDFRIVSLENEVRKLTDRFMAFCESAYRDFKTSSIPVPSPSFMDHLGKIQSMNAESEEEKKQKDDAERQMREILGH